METMNSVINYLISFGAYALGATVLILDQMQKLHEIAETNSNPNIVFKRKTYWQQEKINLIKIFILGIVSIFFLPWFVPGTTISFNDTQGKPILNIPLKMALLPVQYLCGNSGGRLILSLFGKAKPHLYRSVGLQPEEGANKE